MLPVFTHFWVVAAVLLIPAIPLTGAWLRMSSAMRATETHWRLAGFLLILQSASLLHILLGILNSRLLGPDYSSIRYGIIGTWLVISVVTAGLGIIKNPIRWLVVVVGIYLAFDWLYIGAVSSVV